MELTISDPQENILNCLMSMFCGKHNITGFSIVLGQGVYKFVLLHFVVKG